MLGASQVLSLNTATIGGGHVLPRFTLKSLRYVSGSKARGGKESQEEFKFRCILALKHRSFALSHAALGKTLKYQR